MDHTALLHRLNRAQGQIEAIKPLLLNEEGDCVQTLRLVKAANNALKKFGEAYIKAHMDHCLKKGMDPADLQETLEEVISSAFTL